MQLETYIDRSHPDIAVITFKGRLVLGSRLSSADSQIRGLIGEGVRKLIIDLSQVEYTDSSGLGLVIHTFGLLSKEQGELRVVQPNAMILELLKLTRTDGLLKIQPDLPTALCSFAS